MNYERNVAIGDLLAFVDDSAGQVVVSISGAEMQQLLTVVLYSQCPL